METEILKEIGGLKDLGFFGFKKISEVRRDKNVLPNESGIYMVIRNVDTCPKFLAVGTGGYFKGKNPNVDLETLKENWVDNTAILYIGKSSQPIKKRVGQYLSFGEGQSVGHYGGRYIWQLQGIEDCLLVWKVITDQDPRDVERKLIQEFVVRHGKRPFANLVD